MFLFKKKAFKRAEGHLLYVYLLDIKNKSFKKIRLFLIESQ